MIKNKELGKFFQHSYELMQNYKHGRRYYHTLTKEDNSPVVIRDHTDQITYVVKGSGTVYLNGKEQTIKAGNVITIEAGTTIRFTANSEGLTMFHIHIPDVGREEDRRILEGKDINRYLIEQELNMTEVPIIYYCMDCSFSAENKHFKTCPNCGGVISYKRADNQYHIRQGKYDVERYWDFLPLQDPEKLIGQGNERTPLIESQKLKSKSSASKIMLKDETKTVTGSSKDRMAVVALSQMNELGINSFVVSSTGNVASALAFLLNKHRDIQMHCFAAEEFISRHRFMDSPNIIMHSVSSKYDSALKEAFKFANENRIYHDGGYFSVAKRAGLGMAFLEAWEQSKITFDYYFQAVSSGMGVLGVYEIATKMKQSSMIDSIPSLMCVQQSSCDPMVKAFEAGEKSILPEHIVDKPTGIAKAILTGDPTVCYPSLYKVVSETYGSFISVSEDEIKSAQEHLNANENIKAAPDGAVALAGFLKYAETHPDELKDKNVLINITG